MGFNTTDIDSFATGDPSFLKLGIVSAKIAYYNYEWRFNTYVVFNMIQMVSVEEFFRNFKAVLVKKGKYVPLNRVNHVPQFVIFGQHVPELIDLLQWLFQNKYDNTAKFIIVCESLNSEQCNEISLVQSLGENDISNVVYIKLSNDGTPEAFTIYPLRPDKCWNKEPVKIDELTYGCENDTCYSNLFPEKYQNLYKCPFIVSTFKQPPYMQFLNKSDGTIEPSGGDGNILKLIVGMLNATLVLRIPAEQEWGHFVNNNWTGCLGEVFNGRANGAMCSCPLTVTKFGNFQISFTYDSMDIVWGAPMPSQAPSWKKLLYPLPVYLRIIMLIMFIVIIFVNTIAKTKTWYNIMKDLHSKPTRSNLLVYSWVIFLGMPVVKLPRKFPFRLVVYSWIWYCTIVRSLYQATLVSSLKLRIYDDKLENISDVLTRKYPFGGPMSLREYYSDDKVVYDRWVEIPQSLVEETLDKISKGEDDFVLAMNKESIYAHLTKFRGTKQVQVLPQKIVNSPTVMYFKKNSHLCAPISKLLTIYLEAGFAQRLYKEYSTHVKNLLRQPTSNLPEPLRLPHFTGCFVILMLGWLLAAVFFSIELACGLRYLHKI